MDRIRDSRIAVTSLGVISPLGEDLESFNRGLWNCTSCLEELSLFEIGIEPKPIVAQIRDMPLLERKPGFRCSRTDLLFINAASDAVAGLNASPEELQDAGIVTATTVGGFNSVDQIMISNPLGFYKSGGFSSITTYQKGHVADVVAAHLGLGGPRLGVSVACASGSMSIALAAQMIRSGSSRMIIAGGGDALNPFIVSGFHALQTLDAKPCRPFDKGRSGLNLGEGAALLVLEDERHAIERGARISAILVGWGMSNDAYHLTAPESEGRGLAECIGAALAMANLSPDDIDYVNAHGTGTMLNDVAEVQAYERIFGDRKAPIPISSTKSYIGHNLAGAGALEALVTILSLTKNAMPPTLRLQDPIESNAIDWIMSEPRKAQIKRAMNVSAGFGGSNTVLIFENPEG